MAKNDDVGRKLIERWRDRPALFAREVFGVELWARQREIALSVAKSRKRRTAVRSGHKVGKSTLAVIIAIWWVFTRERAFVVLTAPSAHQVKNILWAELRRVWALSRIPLGATPGLDPSTGIELPGARRILGVTTDEPERLAGLSGANILIIVDEASGYPLTLWTPIFGNIAGGGRVLALGNPTRPTGPFYDAFTTKGELWNTHRISSEETPNATEGRMVVPGLATREWIEECVVDWGRESPLYRVRVKGDYAEKAANQIIGLDVLEEALARVADDAGELTLGVDVARFGDDESVIAPRRGAKLHELLAFRGLDGPQLAGRVLDTARQLRRGAERVRVNVDVIGVGASCYDHLELLAQAHRWIEPAAINVSESATGEGFSNLRSQLWFGAEEWLRTAQVANDQRLQGELVSATYQFDPRGGRKVESKDEIKKRLGRSPDRADALCLATYVAPRIEVGIGFAAGGGYAV
jgi:phage terminase large subunit